MQGMKDCEINAVIKLKTLTVNTERKRLTGEANRPWLFLGHT